MRDYSNFDSYLTELYRDVYAQPDDDGHIELAHKVIDWMKVDNSESVLDVGCGTGFCQPMFQKKGLSYTGVCFGADFQAGQKLGYHVLRLDYNFLDYSDNYFDVVFSRHSLEHSPFPIITLLEWHRVGKKFLVLVMPNPENYTYVGRNHYSVANPHQIVWWMRRAGWKLTQARITKTEFWFVAKKMPIVSYEGWATAPLDASIHEFERDMLSSQPIDILRCYED